MLYAETELLERWGTLLRYIFKRVLHMIPVFLLVSLIVFTINYFSPGDPVTDILGPEATAEQIEAKRAELGLNDPYFVQFGSYLMKIFTKFDFGTSYKTGRPVIDEILERAPTTFLLTLSSMLLATVLGITLGIISATKQYSIFDYLANFIALFGASMPAFWLGLMLMLLFSLKLGWLPASGYTTPLHWIMPSVAIAVLPIANITRTTRSSMLDVIRQDYMTTARSKGLNESRIIIKHGLKNALIPVITILGIQMGRTLGGAIVTESIFSIPGLGLLMMNSIKGKNYPSIQGSILFCALAFCVINLLVDILYAYIDPRIKAQYVRSSVRKPGKSAVPAPENKNE